MKIQSTILGVLSLFLLSFGKAGKVPPSNTYNLIYVDNSKSPGKLSLSEEMIELLSRRIDSIKAGRSDFSLFLSNSLMPEYTRKADVAKNLVSNLYNGYTGLPGSITDKRLLSDKLFKEDLSHINAINIYFFVTENYLQSDQAGENLGLFLGFLPKQLQALTRCPEERVNVYLYYPKGSASVQSGTLESFVQFGSARKDFSTKIKFNFLAI